MSYTTISLRMDSYPVTTDVKARRLKVLHDLEEKRLKATNRRLCREQRILSHQLDLQKNVFGRRFSESVILSSNSQLKTQSLSADAELEQIGRDKNSPARRSVAIAKESASHKSFESDKDDTTRSFNEADCRRKSNSSNDGPVASDRAATSMWLLAMSKLRQRRLLSGGRRRCEELVALTEGCKLTKAEEITEPDSSKQDMGCQTLSDE